MADSRQHSDEMHGRPAVASADNAGVGRFIAGVGGLIRSAADETYLLLRRSETKDFAAGVWECITGRVNQGESFEEALRREIQEELGVGVERPRPVSSSSCRDTGDVGTADDDSDDDNIVIEFIIGTTHFYRGKERPENELLGVVYACSLNERADLQLSAEHSEYRWVTVEEADQLLTATDPSTKWTRQVIRRAEFMRRQLPTSMLAVFRDSGFELG